MNKYNRYILLIVVAIFCKVVIAKAQIQFVENKGQWDSKVNFKSDFSTGAFFLQNNGFMVLMHNAADMDKFEKYQHGELATPNTDNNSVATNKISTISSKGTPGITVHSHAYQVNFLGSNKNIQIIPDKVLPTYNNYFIGNDKGKWASNCNIYQAVTYANVYPNIDVRYYTDAGNLKYDLIVHPGGNPNAIAMRYDGADKLEIKNKELNIGTSAGNIKELYPYTYQTIANEKKTIDCKFVLTDNVVRFKVKDYSPTETLIIDPSLIFVSFTGSSADNWGYTATPGPDGSFFAGGIVFDNGYPVSPGAFETTYSGGNNDDEQGYYDVGIFKFSANGSQRLYATYLGGRGNEQPHSMICDAQGNLVVAGRSSSNNFPGAARPSSRTDYDIFITKFNATGTALLGSLMVGGLKDDGVNIRPKYVTPLGTDATRRNYGDDARSEVILDGTGNIFLASCTQSTDFPVSASALQNTYGGGRQDGVILCYNAALTAPIFSTYFGGSGDDACFVLSINPLSGNLYIAGGTNSMNLPGNKTGTINATNQGGAVDGFVTEITPNGTAIISTTYIGTTGDDIVYGLKFDKFGFPYITGTTTGIWPVINANFSNPGSKQFICKLKPDLSAYVYSTIFGNVAPTPNISPTAFLVDRCQNVYVSGWGGGINIEDGYPNSGTKGLPLVNQIPGLPAPDGADFYFFVLEKNANSQLFGCHFGQSGGFGDHVDGGTSRFDENGVIYEAICANCGGPRSATFPTTPGVWAGINPSSACNEAAVKIQMNFAGVGASVKAKIDGVFDTIGCVPLSVLFIDTLNSGKIFIWNYGDGTKNDTTFAPNASSTHVYNNVGTFRLMLVAIDSATCNIADTAYTNVKVGNNDVNPNFSFTKLDSCASLRFQFTNTTTAPLLNTTDKDFTWDFGDGSPRINASFTTPIIHTFPSIGSYKITLSVSDTIYCNSPDSVQQTLRLNPNVRAIFKTNPSGCVPYTATFVNSSLGGISWLWEFGDGQTSTDFEPTHLYASTGSYKVRLIAFDSTTCNKVDTSAYFIITVYPNPTASFTWSPNPPIQNVITTFTNLSTGATRYLWYFGDGDSSTEVNPVHQYISTNTFHVVLIAFNNANCTDTFKADVAIIILPLLAVPNAFTPGKFSGGSYNNGIVKVQGFGIGRMVWKIYNRWGQLVFSANNVSQGWDGTFKGVLQPMDVYTYTLEADFTNGQKVRKTGDITLLR